MRLFLLFFLISFTAYGDWKEFVTRTRVAPDPHFRWESTASETLDQLIDHKNAALGTFKQRYYINDQFASGADAPVFLWVCGEWTCSPNEIARGAIVQHAKTAKARIVALEHRYYGKSQPFATLSTNHLAYLTTQQALDDLVAFKVMLEKKLSLSGKWIAFGGSYPGSLVAYLRNQYPQHFAGALASSGPVMARENFEEYDRHVATVAGPECADKMRAIVKQLETALPNQAEFDKFKALFDAAKVQDNLDFLYLVADTAAFAVQYGYKDPFCESLNGTKPIESWAAFAKQVYAMYRMTAVQLTLQGAMSEDPNEYLASIGLRQWFYQSCTEYGYFQNAYHDANLTSRSSLINEAYHRNGCERLFGKALWPSAEKTNKTFYEPLLKASLTSNVFYTNGEQDPWSLLSISKENGNATNEKTVSYTIEKAAHCDDLAAPIPGDSESLKQARSQFAELILEWLK